MALALFPLFPVGVFPAPLSFTDLASFEAIQAPHTNQTYDEVVNNVTIISKIKFPEIMLDRRILSVSLFSQLFDNFIDRVFSLYEKTVANKDSNDEILQINNEIQKVEKPFHYIESEYRGFAEFLKQDKNKPENDFYMVIFKISRSFESEKDCFNQYLGAFFNSEETNLNGWEKVFGKNPISNPDSHHLSYTYKSKFFKSELEVSSSRSLSSVHQNALKEAFVSLNKCEEELKKRE